MTISVLFSYFRRDVQLYETIWYTWSERVRPTRRSGLIDTCADSSVDLTDQDAQLLLRVLRERVRQLCASAFIDHAAVCYPSPASMAATFTRFNLIVLPHDAVHSAD